MLDIISAVFIIMFLEAFVIAILSSITFSKGVEFVNPSVLYEKFKVNWFGAFFLAILFNLLILPIAIVYWIYKLCTVGRNS